MLCLTSVTLAEKRSTTWAAWVQCASMRDSVVKASALVGHVMGSGLTPELLLSVRTFSAGPHGLLLPLDY